jgi:hypothetical protein
MRLLQIPPPWIKASKNYIEQIPTNPATTTSSRGSRQILILVPRPRTRSELIQRAPAVFGPGGHPPWMPRRERV